MLSWHSLERAGGREGGRRAGKQGEMEGRKERKKAGTREWRERRRVSLREIRNARGGT